MNSAAFHDMPAAMSPAASMYVGMQCAMEIHSAAKLYVDQRRSATRTGARSWLKSGLSASCAVAASSSSTRPSS